MKKIISFITVFVFLISFSRSFFGSAAAQYETDDAITIDLLGHFGTSGAYDIEVGEWFRRSVESVAQKAGSDVDLAPAPQNIYLLMYTQVKSKPKKTSIRKVLDKNKTLTEEELQALLNGKDVRNIPLALEKTGTAEKIQQLPKRAGELQAEFDLEKEIAEFESEVEGEVAATEIFANGDTGDSGFDLLYDLNIVHSILFGEPYTFFGSGGPGNPAGAAVRNVGGDGGADGGAQQGVGAAAGGAAGVRAGVPAGDNGIGNGVPPQAGGANQDQFNPDICFADQGLARAVNNFARGIQQGGGQGGAGQAGVNAGGAGGAPQGGGIQQGGGAGQAGNAGDSGEANGLEPAAAGDWSRPIPCTDRFCVTVEMKVKTEHARPPTANCIACHVEKMNDAYGKLTGRNLTPSKATGNLIELPKCKAGISLPNFLNFNFVVIPSPIITPPNDDLVDKNDFLKEFSIFLDKYSPFPKPKKTIGGSGNKIEQDIPDIIEQAEKRALAQTTDQTTINKLSADINAEVAAKRREAANVLKQYQVLSRANNFSTHYKALIFEMNTMNAYFRSFQTMFGNMQTPCKRLLDKQYCQ